MKSLITLCIALISVVGFSQTKYEKGMQKAFDLWQADKPWEAANVFERIAQAEPDNWLPPYYVASINTIYSFGEQDEAKLTAQLGKARDFINDAMAISKDNVDIMILEAQWYTAWIAFDGQQYGMTYSAKVVEKYQKALAISPDNPRVILSKAEWDIGSAQFFGTPIDSYCKDVQRAVELFTTFKPEGKFYPEYGMERAQQLMETTCKQ